MTSGQLIFLMASPGKAFPQGGLWHQACVANGWSVKDRAKRLEVLSAAVGRVIESSKDLNQRDDFDRVKAALLIANDHVAAAMEQDHEGRARRVMQQVDEMMRCLALYVEDAPAYARAIIQDKVLRGARRTRVPEIAELATTPRHFTKEGKVIEVPSHLEQLLYTLSARVNGKAGLRKQAGHSLHDMRSRAGLVCDCAAICRGAVRRELVVVGGQEEGDPF